MTHPISFANVAMLCEGPELYGVGSVLRLYALAAPDTLFVCAQEGHFSRWLAERSLRRIVLDRRFRMDARRSSLAFLARVGAGLRHTRRSARILDPLLRAEGIRLVHSHWFEQQVVAGHLRRRGFGSVWHLHNTTSTTRLMGLGLRLNHALARWGCDVLMPVSRYIAAPWLPSRVAVHPVHNAATPIFDAPNTLPPSPLRCLIAARLDPKKGVHLAVGAVLDARRAGRDVTLDVFGGPLDDNPYAGELLARVRNAGQADHVRFRGFDADLRRHHQSFHLGLQCRIDPEPCSVWVCETLVDGLPLVAANNGGTPELVEEDATGLLFAPGDQGDLLAKLLLLADNPARLAAMRPAAFARGRAHFTTERMIAATLEAYQSAIRAQ